MPVPVPDTGVTPVPDTGVTPTGVEVGVVGDVVGTVVVGVPVLVELVHMKRRRVITHHIVYAHPN